MIQPRWHEISRGVVAPANYSLNVISGENDAPEILFEKGIDVIESSKNSS